MNKEVIDHLKMVRELMNQKRMRFEPRLRDDKDYIQVLLEDFGITPLAAWNIIYDLKPQMHFIDPKPDYSRSGTAFTFKRKVNGIDAYIKVSIEEDELGALVICISFHKDC